MNTDRKDFTSTLVFTILIHLFVLGLMIKVVYPQLTEYFFDRRNLQDDLNEYIEDQRQLFKKLTFISNKNRRFEGANKRTILTFDSPSTDVFTSPDQPGTNKEGKQGKSDSPETKENKNNKVMSSDELKKNKSNKVKKDDGGMKYESESESDVMLARNNKNSNANEAFENRREIYKKVRGENENTKKGISAKQALKSLGKIGRESGSKLGSQKRKKGGGEWKSFSIATDSQGNLQMGTVGVDDYNHRLYLNQMINKIGKVWRYNFPFQQMAQRTISPGEATISFEIDNQTGRILSVDIRNEDFQQSLNSASLRTVTGCKTFGPPPRGIQYRRLTVRFVYHPVKETKEVVIVTGTAYLRGDVRYPPTYKDVDKLPERKYNPYGMQEPYDPYSDEQ